MEQWKKIPGIPGYLASNTGYIKSITRTVLSKAGTLRRYPEVILKLSKQRNGYLAVPISCNGVEKRMSVHRLVAAAFYGLSALQVNHKNGNKHDNSVDNLEYCSASQNLKHSFRTGLSNINGERHPISKLTNEQARDIYRRANNGESSTSLAKEYSVVISTISNIKAGRSYASVTQY